MRRSCITIERQYGSGGREVGRILSHKLGIPFYDGELLHGKPGRNSCVKGTHMMVCSNRWLNGAVFTASVLFGTEAFLYESI